MTPFEPEGSYSGIPYRVLPDGSIDAMLPGGLVRFKDIDQLLAAIDGARNNDAAKRSILPYDVLGNLNERYSNVPALPTDYYSLLRDAINRTEQNSAQLRALVFERARFNIRRDMLFGYSSMDWAELVRNISEFERAVAQIETEAANIKPATPDSHQVETSDASPSSPSVETDKHRNSPDIAETHHLEDPPPSSSKAIQVLPPSPSAQPEFHRVQRMDSFQSDQRPEEVVLYARSTSLFIGILLLAMMLVGAAIVADVLWRSPRAPVQVANNTQSPPAVRPPPIDKTPKLPYPLPTSYGVYALNGNKLVELNSLPIRVPDPRIALSAELKSGDAPTLSDHTPAFIIFRRDLVNNAPPKIALRVIARMTRETKIINSKAVTIPIEGSWRIRNISHEFSVSPVPGQREMIIARPEGGQSLPSGRYALVFNRRGYDVKIGGPMRAPEFCLEEFDSANGVIFNQCRSPPPTHSTSNSNPPKR